MKIDRFKRMEELFNAALELPPDQRTAYLEKACGEDTALLGLVARMLGHEDDNTASLRSGIGVTPTRDEPDATPREIPQTLPLDVEPSPSRPTSVGPYRIVREIGRGGMGVVYLGVHEDDSFKRRVAVKVLKRGMDTDDILTRFQRERQVLGALNHPAIAHLYDVGETTDGRPYFAMEYIEGQPIDDYCDTHRLRIAERLDLFRQVCSAVHHVHQHLMVHRDLKPSNILITESGVPKLLDFGIAKLISPEISPLGSDPTSVERRMMTLEYASPEQVRGNPIGVASDIYSLGVILYELLTGHRPYHIKSLVRAEIERVICDVDPERPSTAATRVEVIDTEEDESETSTITPELVAKVREGRPDRLRRRLAGDLDNVVLMAMRKEPQRRYRSTDQFGEDIRRHLDGLPVIARHDTAGYRLAKFVRRHRRGVAAAAVMVLALIGWGVTAAHGWLAETRHARVVEAERDRTRRMLDQVLHLAHVFVSELPEMIKPLDGSLPSLKLLAETAQECLEGIRPDVGDDARLLRELAAAYDAVGQMWGGRHNETFGNTTIALANYRTALAMRQQLLARHPDEQDLRYKMARTHANIGDVLRFTGEVDAALEAFNTYLEIVESLHRDNPEYGKRFAGALGIVGAALKDHGRLAEARLHQERSLAVRRGILAERPGDERAIQGVGVGLVYVGSIVAMMGDKQGALEMYRESITVRERLVLEHPDHSCNRRQLGLSHYFVAGKLLELDRPREATAHVQTAVHIFEQRAEANPMSVRAPLQDLAMAREIQGRLHAALGEHDQALESYGRHQALVAALLQTNPSHTLYRAMLADIHGLIGDVREQMGDLPTAVWAYRQAHETIKPAAEADPDDVDLQVQLARILSALGGLLGEMGELIEALGRLDDARSIQESVIGDSPEHARARDGLVMTHRQLSRLAVRRGDSKEALEHALKAVQTARRRDAGALRDLAAAQALNDDAEQAFGTAREAIDLLAESTGPASIAMRKTLERDLAAYGGPSEGR